jgi:beta-lactamase regulating signal transducer with metallopeptidase domain
MNRISEAIPTFLLNAAWQVGAVALVASACARCLRDAPALLRHSLWVAALTLSVALPLLSLCTSSSAQPTPEAIHVFPAEPAREAPGAVTQPSRPPAADVPAVSVHEASTNVFSPARVLRQRRHTLTSPPALPLALAACYLLFLLSRVAVLYRAWQRTQSLRRSALSLEVPSRLAAVAERCRAAFGLRRLDVRCSFQASVPVALGAREPLIILPASLFDAATAETLASVVGHEAAHVARRDFALNLAYELLLLPVSFHPLARMIKRQIDRTRELACDELVAGRVVASDTYARSLLRVAGALASPAHRAFTLGVFDADILEERIMRLTRNTRRTTPRAARLLALAALPTLGLSCLALSTFSFDLRTAGATATDQGRAVNGREAPSAKGERPAQRLNEKRAQERGDERVSRTESIRGLNSDDAQARADAACEAGRTHAVEQTPALVSMLGDEASVSLIHCWERGDWSPALETFKQPTPGEQAAIALASFGKPSFEPLKNSLADARGAVRRNAAWAIGELTNMRDGERAGAVPQLISLLSDSDEWVRMASARALGEIRDERAADKLIAALADGEWRVRQVAAWALSELKDEGAVEALCRLLVSDAQGEVRQTAAMALGEIRSQKALPSLKQALGDAQPRVREKAKWAISEIDDGGG